MPITVSCWKAKPAAAVRHFGLSRRRATGLGHRFRFFILREVTKISIKPVTHRWEWGYGR
jgi:hypothetical protein